MCCCVFSFVTYTFSHSTVFVCPHASCVWFYHMCAPCWVFPLSLCDAWWSSIFRPSVSVWASRSVWHQPITSSHIVLWSTSHHLLMPTVAMWSYLSLWSCPRCLPVALSVSKRLLGTNPSCHSRQWIMAPNLSAFMTRVHIDYQLHTQQTTLYTRSVPAAQWITSN